MPNCRYYPIVGRFLCYRHSPDNNILNTAVKSDNLSRDRQAVFCIETQIDRKIS